jgi:hypothetical protein
MQTKAIGRGICTAAALAAVAAVPATADAAKRPYKEATFKATLSGSQVTTWEYHHKLQSGCDVAADGYGDQTIKFDAGRSFKVTFARPPKGQPNLFSSNGRPIVTTFPIGLPLRATAERNGDYKVNYQEHRQCDGGAGGGGETNLPPKDCGMRTGSFNFRLFFRDPSLDDEIVIPLPHPLAEKNSLKLEGNYYRWGQASTLDDTYKNCPLLLEDTYVEKAGNIFTSPAKLVEKQVFDTRRKRFVVSGHHIANGQTILAWNLRLTRVK